MIKAETVQGLIVGYWDGKGNYRPIRSWRDFVNANELVTIQFCWKYRPDILEQTYWDNWADDLYLLYFN